MTLTKEFVAYSVSQAISAAPKAQISPAETIGPELRHRASVALRQQPPSAKLSPPSAVRIGAREIVPQPLNGRGTPSGVMRVVLHGFRQTSVGVRPDRREVLF